MSKHFDSHQLLTTPGITREELDQISAGILALAMGDATPIDEDDHAFCLDCGCILDYSETNICWFCLQEAE